MVLKCSLYDSTFYINLCNMLQILDEHYGSEGVARQGVELLLTTLSKMFGSLQAAYKGKLSWFLWENIYSLILNHDMNYKPFTLNIITCLRGLCNLNTYFSVYFAILERKLCFLIALLTSKLVYFKANFTWLKDGVFLDYYNLEKFLLHFGFFKYILVSPHFLIQNPRILQLLNLWHFAIEQVKLLESLLLVEQVSRHLKKIWKWYLLLSHLHAGWQKRKLLKRKLLLIWLLQK